MTRDPGTGEVLAKVCAGQPADVDPAVQAARAFAKSGWAEMAPNDRGVLMHGWRTPSSSARVLGQIEALDCGKVYAQAEADAQNFVDTPRYFTNMSLHVQHRSPLAVARHEAWTVRAPVGSVRIYLPVEFPVFAGRWGIAPAWRRETPW